MTSEDFRELCRRLLLGEGEAGLERVALEASQEGSEGPEDWHARERAACYLRSLQVARRAGEGDRAALAKASVKKNWIELSALVELASKERER